MRAPSVEGRRPKRGRRHRCYKRGEAAPAEDTRFGSDDALCPKPHALMKVEGREGIDPTTNTLGVVPRRQRQRDQRMPPPRRQDDPVHDALKLLVDRS
jgi:hypothetical protein